LTAGSGRAPGRARGRRTDAGLGLVVGRPILGAAPRFVVTALAAALLLLPGVSGADGRTAGRQPVSTGGPEDRREPAARPPQHPGPRRSSLAEAARRNRERIERSRRRGGPAPRYDDAALPGERAPDSADPGPAESSTPRSVPAATDRRNGEGSPAGEPSLEASDSLGLRDPGSRGEASAADRAAARREQERALRERLLDLEWSLAAVGASGLPYAPRNPNRALNPLGAGRLRARQEEIRRELAALAEETGAEKRRPPR